MDAHRTHTFRRLAVIGAGNMGSGIAQKMATEGFDVTLVDVDDGKVARGLATIRTLLDQGVERKVFRPDQADAIHGRVHGTSDWQQLADIDLVVEAVFEDIAVKREVFARLDEVCRPDAILGTNTSSMSVTELAAATSHPERVIGLHYFFHPAKNRLVEVVPGARTDEQVVRAAWGLQEQLGKTPIVSTDAAGFVVNRYFVPWLNEAVRMLEEGFADVPTIEAAAQQTFGVGMGPFELMNVTGVPIALHAAATLGERFGRFYAPARRLAEQVESGRLWSLGGEPDASKLDRVSTRMLGVVFQVAGSLVDEGVGTIEDTDIGARVGLRWPLGPFELMNRQGVGQALGLAREAGRRYELAAPAVLVQQAEGGEPFRFELVRSTVEDGIATLTVNRPDAMNALNEAVVAQLHEAFQAAADDEAVSGIVIAGAGKAFIAGADIRFFVRNIEQGDIDRIETFTRAGHALLDAVDRCEKPVIARLHGLALGGGLELALACDRIFATPRAMLAFPETGIGIYPGLGGTQRTPRKIGVGLAKWLIFTGDTLDARRAHDVGLVDRVVDHDALDAAIRREIADPSLPGAPTRDPGYGRLELFFDRNDVAAIREGRAESGGNAGLERAIKQVGFKAPIALGLAEKLIDEGHRLPLPDGLALELAHLREIFGSEDALEGLSSLGQRRPEFKGR